MTLDALKKELSDIKAVSDQPFDYLQKISKYVNNPETEDIGRDLVIRALAVRQAFNTVDEVLISLVHSVGLYPYLNNDCANLSFRDHVAYELHRPENLEKDDIILHRLQFEVYNRLLRGENVVLSAPTSSGKSLLIDALIATKRYKTVVIVVPTLALIDETRRRLLRRFSSGCKIITHQSQKRSDDVSVSNIYILTQERVLERDDINTIDLFVMDEFYKIDFRESREDERDRTLILNAAFYRLAKRAKQFYLLGPNIQAISGLKDVFECYFKSSNFATVAVNYERVNLKNKTEDKNRALIDLCKKIEQPILVYCQSPTSAQNVAKELTKAKLFTPSPGLNATLEWIKQNYHEDWIFYQALSNGIGIHHGSIPRALQQQCVRFFNEGLIKALVCTSTFIEGVNSEAKSIIIYDRRISNNKPLDSFTYKNIEGRAGRMFKHFIGSVYSLEKPPTETSNEVDFPICHQDETSDLDLLLQIDEEDLTKESLARINTRFSTMLLPDYIVKQNLPVSIESQEALAREIHSKISYYKGVLSWSGKPTYQQLLVVSKLMVTYISKPKSIASSEQLELVIRRFFTAGSLTAYLKNEINEYLLSPKADISVSDVIDMRLSWIRNVISHYFPRNLMVLESIQKHVLAFNGVSSTADYSFYASRLENLHMDSSICTLDEYGVPYQTAEMLGGVLKTDGGLDAVLAQLIRLKISLMPISIFEKEILQRIQEELAA